jgi:hypothetical protein
MTGRIVSLPRATAVLEDTPALPPASLRGLRTRHQRCNTRGDCSFPGTGDSLSPLPAT